MLFHTFEFALFFVAVLALYWGLARHVRAQNALLIVSSYFFYGWWDYRFLFLVAFSTAMDYSAALMIERGRLTLGQRVRASLLALGAAFFFVTVRWDALHLTRAVAWADLLPRAFTGWRVFLLTLALVAVAWALYPWFGRMPEHRRRRCVITLSLCGNLGLLGFFKYFNFFADNLNVLFQTIFGYTLDSFTLHILLPVGISFYTFQTMSYTLDVYRKEFRAEESLLTMAAFVAFFPQLVAGPIERARHLLPQFVARRTISWQDCKEGAELIAWGLYKKMVVADNLARLVNETFKPYDTLQFTGMPEDGLRCLGAIYAFAFQIYGDFSGYSDIARGTARLLGFEIMVNFDLPYAATSPSDFWRRWHISLSRWLRDYLYIPLGGNRRGNVNANLMITMLLGGLWHGAAWTFVVWGAYHGALLVAYRVAGVGTERNAYSRPVTFCLWLVMFHLVCLGWLFFRAQHMSTVVAFLHAMALHPGGSPEAWAGLRTVLFYGWFLVSIEAFQYFTQRAAPLERLPWFARLNWWIVVILSLIALAPHTRTEFIYFAF